MGVVYLNESTLSDIADAIRYKENSSNVYYPNQMGMAIRNLNGGGGGEVDRALIPDLNFPNYQLNMVKGISLVNELPDDAVDVYRCDIGEASISKPAYAFKNAISGTQYNMGIYSPVNDINNISILNMANAFTNSQIVLKSGASICGDLTYDMSNAFYQCSNLLGEPKIGPKVKYVYATYFGCNVLTGSPVCGNYVDNFEVTYTGCNNLTGSPVCGPNVVSMRRTYENCFNLIGSPVCGVKVGDMSYAYRNCRNLTGNPVVGQNVTNMVGAYSGCSNLVGNPVIGPNVVNMQGAYLNCSKLTGNAVFSPLQQPSSSFIMFQSYGNCVNLTGIDIPDEWITMNNFARNCIWYRGTAECGKNVIYMDNAYNNCPNMIGNAVFGEAISHPRLGDYNNCYNITGIEIRNNNANMSQFAVGVKGSDGQNWYRGNAYCPPNTVNMYAAYTNCLFMAGSPACGDAVVNFMSAYSGCSSLTGQPVCGNNVIDMGYAYFNCRALTGSPVCGNNVTSMSHTYANCVNLTGSPVVGPNVVSMWQTYAGCTNLTGEPVIGPLIGTSAGHNVQGTYMNCYRLTGRPIIPYLNNTGCDQMYYNCGGLSGTPTNIEGEGNGIYHSAYGTFYNCRGIEISNYSISYSINNLNNMFYNCPNIYGNIYIHCNLISTSSWAADLNKCFYGRDNSRQLNLFVVAGGAINYWLSTRCMPTSGARLTWTQDTANSCYYNTADNLYVYYTLS